MLPYRPLGRRGFAPQDDGLETDLFRNDPAAADNTGLLPLVSGDGSITFQSPSVGQTGTGTASSSTSTPLNTGSTSAFVINVSYDSSVSSAPAGFTSAIQYAVQYLESVITVPVTVNIQVGYGEIEGQSLGSNALGESSAFLSNYSYSSIKAALTSVDPTAAASLPSTAPGNMWVTTAEAKALGLAGPSSNIDGYASFSSTLPFTYDPNNRAVTGDYDFIGVVEHEFSEDLGRIDLFGATLSDGVHTYPNAYSLLDLNHYTSPGAHTYTGTSANYFSVNNGTTNLDNFNTNPNGDLGDWASSAGHDAFLAFTPSGNADTLSQADLAELNALGYSELIPTGPPTLTPHNLQETSGEAPVALSSQVTYSDPANVPPVLWRIQDVSTDGSQALLLNGAPLNAAGTIQVSEAQFAQITIGPVTSAHQIWAVASDGTFDSNVVNFTVSAQSTASAPPTLTPHNLQETSGEAPVALSSQVTYSDPADLPPVLWRIQDVSSDGSQALLLNGSPLNAAGTIQVSEAQFAQITIGPVTSAHQIWAVASDGTFDSNVVNFTVSPPASIAVSGTSSEVLQGGTASALLSAPAVITDASSTISGATITIASSFGNVYPGDELFIDGQQSSTVDGGAVTVGWNGSANTLTLSGVAPITTYDALLAQITFQDTGVDSAPGSHPTRTVTWSVNDGTQTLTTTSQVTIDRAPTLAESNLSETAGEQPVALSTMVPYSDLDGDPPLLWRIQDISTDGSLALLFNGSPLNAAGTIQVSEAQFAQITIGPVTSAHQIWAVAKTVRFTTLLVKVPSDATAQI